MALIDCPQCKKPISDKARKCPHCGLDLTVPYEPPQPQPQRVENSPKKSRKIWPIFVAIAGVIIVGIALWFFVFNNPKTNETPIVETARESTEFPYNTSFTGTIGSRGSMYIDSYGGGSYTYDNNGTSLTRSIKVKSYDGATGHLLIESYNKSGDYVGLFDGYTRNNNFYSGVFTNYKGGTVEFQLSINSENDPVSTPSSSRYVVINATELRLRLGPSTSADTFKWSDGSNRHPNKGEKYLYLGESGDFYKINYKGYELWVSKQYTYLE